MKKKECEHLEHVITMQGTTLYLDFPLCALIRKKCIGKECPFHQKTKEGEEK